MDWRKDGALRTWTKDDLENFRMQHGYYPLQESLYGPGVIEKMESRIREVMSMDPIDSFEEANLHFLSVDSIEIKMTKVKGKGVFALEKIKQGDYVGEYMGVLTIEEPEAESVYLMQTELGIFIDAKHYGNFTRFINHGCKPNLVTDVVYDKGRIKLVLMAKRDINVAEELTYYYQDVTCKRHQTRCMCLPGCRYVIGSSKFQNDDEPWFAHKCPHCDMHFQSKSLLERHLYIHSTDQTFKCSIWDRAFKQDSALARHMKTHQQRYVCRLCKKKKVTFTRVDTFNKHLMLTHGVAEMSKNDFAENIETFETTENEDVLTENIQSATSKQLKNKTRRVTTTRSKNKRINVIDEDSSSFDEVHSKDEENMSPITQDTNNKQPVITTRHKMRSADKANEVNERNLQECVTLQFALSNAAPIKGIGRKTCTDAVVSTNSDPCISTIPFASNINEISSKRKRDSEGNTGNEKKKSKEAKNKGKVIAPTRNLLGGNTRNLVIQSNEEMCSELPWAPEKAEPRKRLIAEARMEINDAVDSTISDPCVPSTSKQTSKKGPLTPPRRTLMSGNRGTTVIETDVECVKVTSALRKPSPIKRTAGIVRNKDIPATESTGTEFSEVDPCTASSSRRPRGRPRTRPLTPPGTVIEKKAVGRPKTNPGPYRCDPCAREFTCSGNLAKHQEEYHKSGPGYKCPRCKIVCASKKLLSQHLPVHKSREQRTLYQCPSCLKCFTRKPEVRLHQLREANDCTVMEPKIIRPRTRSHNTNIDTDDSGSSADSRSSD